MKKLLLLALFILALGACDWFDDSPSGPDPTIFTDGRVVSTLPGQIDCEDDSRTIPEGKLALIEWVVRSPLGNTADSGTTSPKGEITFNGLAAGDYTVEQTAHLDDGSEGPPKVYNVGVQ